MVIAVVSSTKYIYVIKDVEFSNKTNHTPLHKKGLLYLLYNEIVVYQ